MGKILNNTRQKNLFQVETQDDGRTGIEQEEVIGEEITSPFDPTLIQVTTKFMTIDLLINRIKDGSFDLNPSFQRKEGIWTDAAQSRLIESLLIRIPIPAFYVDATEEDKWLIVDGLQRLTTLKRFVIDKKLKLSGLEFLTQLDGYGYEDLNPAFKRRIMETQMVIYKIEYGTPPDVKFNIFKRINTGGLPLSAQEIRHALNQGESTEFLARLAKSKEFETAHNKSIKDKRMADQECVLRFIAFTLTPYIEYKGDLDYFLSEAMSKMNKMSYDQLDEFEQKFYKAMIVAYKIFGKYAFRKMHNRARKSLINKALFETWAVNLGNLSDYESDVLVKKKDIIVDKFIDLMKMSDFNDAVSQGTGDIKRVNLRFREVKRIIDEVLSS